MKQILARLAALVRHLLVRRHDGVANRALGLAFQGADHVLPEGGETVDYGAVLAGDVISKVRGKVRENGNLTE